MYVRQFKKIDFFQLVCQNHYYAESVRNLSNFHCLEKEIFFITTPIPCNAQFQVCKFQLHSDKFTFNTPKII